MQKMKTVFVVDRATHMATDEVQAEWVLNGEGRATVKMDGTSCMVLNDKLYKRFDAKHGKSVPEGAIPCEPTPDPISGHFPHWVEVDANDPASKWHTEAFVGHHEDGTYELIGPKIQGNRYKLDRHELWRHGAVEVTVERTREALLAWLHDNEHEGLVFHHEDGRMAKIRRKDFGIRW